MSTIDEFQIIDFTKGIKSEQIQHNFQAAQNQISNERAIVAGSGVIEGLQYDTSAPYDSVRGAFPFTVSNGSFVDSHGNEFAFQGDTAYVLSPTPIQSELPLSSKTVRVDGTISITDSVPYSSTGLVIAADDLENNGLNLKDSNGNSISPILGTQDNPGIITNDDMSETIVKLDAEKYGGRIIGGTYTTVQPHDELIYIGTDLKLHTVPSIDSSSPSIMDVVPSDCLYLLCAVGVQILPYANVVVKKDFKRMRNLYTDPDNNLYICGTKFDDLQIVYTQEPKDPETNSLWYDAVTNKLLVWSTENGISGWKAANDFSTHPVLKYKIWDPTITNETNPGDLRILPGDLKTFMFNEQQELDMLFVPGENELQVIIDNSILMSDEFEEITKFDTMTPGEIDTSSFENYGIGFRLKTPLDRAGYVEARITHRVYDNPLRVRFQRTATFVSEATIKCVADPVLGIPEYFDTNIPYKYGEGQIEIFVEGKKLLPRTPDIEENLDYEFLEDSDDFVGVKEKGVQLKKFKIPKSQFELLNGQRITYRITTSIYSYDDVFKIVEDIQTSSQDAITKANQATADVATLTTTITDGLADKQTQIDSNRTDLESHILVQDNFYDSVSSKLKYSSMPSEITTWIPKGLINTIILKQSDVTALANIAPEDFVILLDVEANRMLIRDTDYSISLVDGTTYLNLSANAVVNGHNLYLTGIKFSA
jgi:hypothetical protein